MLENPPVYSITASSLHRYYEYHRRGTKSLLQLKNEVNLSRGVFNGEMSQTTRNQLRKKLSIYFDSIFTVGTYYRKKNEILNTITTLTLPARQENTDNEIKRECLMRWIELAKKKYDVRFYYWVAEKQKNENIHFHILTDRYMDKDWVRDCWNNRLDTLGYLDRFEQNHHHRNPNSTDIQKIRNLAKSSEYVTKYTSKVNQQGKIEGRLHGESDLVRNLDSFKVYGFHEFDLKLQELMNTDSFRVSQNEHCVSFYGNVRNFLKRECPKHYKRFIDYHRQIADSFYCN